VRKISAPTLYVLGGASKIVPPETQEQLQKTLPNVRIVIMPKLGHYPHVEAPDEYVRIVQAFLSESRAR
jgi:pimeloyl-ACP methyl ester carboxylesterase